MRAFDDNHYLRRDSPSTSGSGSWIDAVTGRHSASDAASLLGRRRLLFHKSFGWCYDVWPEQASSYALSGANGRYLLDRKGQLYELVGQHECMRVQCSYCTAPTCMLILHFRFCHSIPVCGTFIVSQLNNCNG